MHEQPVVEVADGVARRRVVDICPDRAALVRAVRPKRPSANDHRHGRVLRRRPDIGDGLNEGGQPLLPREHVAQGEGDRIEPVRADQSQQLVVRLRKFRLHAPARLTEEPAQQARAQEVRFQRRRRDQDPPPLNRHADGAVGLHLEAAHEVLEPGQRKGDLEGVAPVLAPPVAELMRRWLQHLSAQDLDVVTLGPALLNLRVHPFVVAGQSEPRELRRNFIDRTRRRRCAAVRQHIRSGAAQEPQVPFAEQADRRDPLAKEFDLAVTVVPSDGGPKVVQRLAGPFQPLKEAPALMNEHPRDAGGLVTRPRQGQQIRQIIRIRQTRRLAAIAQSGERPLSRRSRPAHTWRGAASSRADNS